MILRTRRDASCALKGRPPGRFLYRDSFEEVAKYTHEEQRDAA